MTASLACLSANIIMFGGKKQGRLRFYPLNTSHFNNWTCSCSNPSGKNHRIPSQFPFCRMDERTRLLSDIIYLISARMLFRLCGRNGNCCIMCILRGRSELLYELCNVRYMLCGWILYVAGLLQYGWRGAFQSDSGPRGPGVHWERYSAVPFIYPLVLKHGCWRVFVFFFCFCFPPLIHYRGFRYHEKYWRSHSLLALDQHSTQRRQGMSFSPSNQQFSQTVSRSFLISLYFFPWFFSQKTFCIPRKDRTPSSNSQILGLPKRRPHSIPWPLRATLPITLVRVMVCKSPY